MASQGSTEEKKPSGQAALVRLQHFTQNEGRALLSLYKYHQSDDEDARGSGQSDSATRQDASTETALVCLSIINDLARNQHERLCLKRSLEDCQLPSASTPTSFLSVLDNARRLLSEAKESEDAHDTKSEKYHFIRLLHEYQQRCHVEGRYLLAKEFMEHENRLRKEEELRQIDTVKQKHDRNRNKLVASHLKQLEEFKENWATFLGDFEQKSQEYIRGLEQTHQQQLTSLNESVSDSMDKKPKKWSRELMQYRERQLLLADRQQYHEAQQTKLVSDALEAKERSRMNSSLDTSLAKRERSMTKQHRSEMDVLVKRIESKRREHTKKMDEDISKLLQRNKNIVAAFDAKHASECSKLASAIEQHVKNMIKEM